MTLEDWDDPRRKAAFKLIKRSSKNEDKKEESPVLCWQTA
jgi:hypothetical protein